MMTINFPDNLLFLFLKTCDLSERQLSIYVIHLCDQPSNLQIDDIFALPLYSLYQRVKKGNKDDWELALLTHKYAQ